MKRRTFIALGAGTLLGGALGADLLRRHLGAYPAPQPLPEGQQRYLSDKEIAILTAAVPAVLHGAAAPATPPLGEVVLSIDAYLRRHLATAPPEEADDMHRLLWLIEHGPALLRLGASRFTRLPPEERAAFLASWSRSGLGILRGAFRGLKQLAAMGYYRHPAAWPALGYGGPMVPEGYDIMEHGG